MKIIDGERRYGVCAGNTHGRKENPNHCIEAIFVLNGWISRQCSRNRGHGPDGLYCKQHAKRHEWEP